MKKVIMISLLLFLIVLCSGCEGDVTRALRHDGFNLSGNKFECSAFFNDENVVETIKYFTGGHIITAEGRIYEVSTGKTFSNGQNCKLAETNIHVKSILDNNIVRAEDNKIYRLFADNGHQAYTPVETSDNNYATYALLLGAIDVEKVITQDSQNNIYYVLKRDGNVYGYSLTKPNRDTPPKVGLTSVVYDSNAYGGPIIDFGYAGEGSMATFVRTYDRFFHLKVQNKDECSKFADIPCSYLMEEDSVLAENAEFITVYNGSTIITSYQKIFSISN